MEVSSAPFAQQVTFLNTSSLKATAEFYGGTLGLPLVYETPGFVLFYQIAPGSFLGICLRADRTSGDSDGAIPTLVVGTTKEVDAWQVRLEAAGVELEKRAGPGISSDGKNIPGIYNLFIRDPAGYLVEIQVFVDPAWPKPPPALLSDGDSEQLVSMSATQVVSQLALGIVTPMQLIDAFVLQHAKTEAAVNAVPTVCVDRARAAAAKLTKTGHPSPVPPGYLYGLPVIIKDLTAVEGVRLTHGSPIYRDNVSTSSDPIVLQLEAKGAIIVGKSNTPEFGAGSNTFNPVFGATVSPFDVRRSAGGSSGGAAAALASGTAWLATGSDLGGSLRIPAAFCGVYGFRVSPGRIGRNGMSGPLVSLHPITGPMARNVVDLALFLDAMIDWKHEQQAGWTFSAPFNLPPSCSCYSDIVAPAVYRSLLPSRVAWSPDLNGLIRDIVDPETLAMCEAAARFFATADGGGAEFSTACPDLHQSRMIFNVSGLSSRDTRWQTLCLHVFLASQVTLHFNQICGAGPARYVLCSRPRRRH
jgi:catechol 2,3-dioxygenase-like lactoylglutathione lyase family enzyme